jgi:hypothetical protein
MVATVVRSRRASRRVRGHSGQRRIRFTSSSPRTCATNPLAPYKLLGISITDPTRAPVVTSDNIQSLSGKTTDQALAILKARYPGTDFRFFDVPGGSIAGNRPVLLSEGTARGQPDDLEYSQDVVQ